MNTAKKIIAAVLGLIIVFAAAVELPLPDRRASKRGEETPPAALSLLYRDAERILLCSCIRVETAEDGEPRPRFRIDEVLEGPEPDSRFFSFACAAAAGAQYLLYLKTPEPTEEEQKPSPVIMTGAPIPVEDGRLIWENRAYSVDSVRRDIARQRAILTVPSQSFYYDDLDSLALACDQIVIARVLSVGDPVETVCRSVEKGESTLSTVEQIFVRIKVENGFYGGLPYGTRLTVAISPDYSRPVINATDLTPVSFPTGPTARPTPGSVYIFFLLENEDPRSEVYFPVNPYEGCVLLLENNIIHSYYNNAFLDIYDLKLFSRRLQEIFFPPEPEEPAE